MYPITFRKERAKYFLDCLLLHESMRGSVKDLSLFVSSPEGESSA